MTPLESIRFAKPVNTPDWGEQKTRLYVTDREADITLDLDARIAVLRGHKSRSAKPVIIPLENVVQWHTKPPADKPRKSSSAT